MSFEPHEVIWDGVKIARYWDHLSKLPGALENCWSRQVGRALLRHVCRYVRLTGRILDYGCGPGYLLRELLNVAPTALVQGADYSPETVKLVNGLLGAEERFGGASLVNTTPTHYDASSFDVVFFVETIEHIPDAMRGAALAELRRLLRPGGTVVVTTPNEEDLGSNQTMCPDCGALFHRIQHLSSWSRESLQRAMEAAGFRSLRCDALHLRPAYSVLHALRDRFLRKQQLPHLVYLGIAR